MKVLKKYRTFKSSRELGRLLLSEVARLGPQTISFDVFDTLVHRRVHPDAIVWAVSKWLAAALNERGIPINVDCNEARHRAYVHLIHLKAAEGLDLDVSLDELVLPWVRECAGGMFDGDEMISRELAERESDYEVKSCFCNPDFLELVKELKKRGARVIYTSDMYLGAKYVDRILNACGYANLFDAAYVSGDFALLKRTGRLFDAVLLAEGLKPHDLFHVGDSVLSDGRRAAEKGIKALVHINDCMVKRHQRMEYDYRRAKVEPDWMGVISAQYTEAGLAETGTPEEAYGRRVLGPIYSSFIHRIIERCKEEGIDKVYFMAREGYVLKTLFDQFAPKVYGADENIPETYYLGVSRLTTFIAAMRTFSLKEITASFNNTPHYSIRSLFAPLQIASSSLSMIAARHGFTDIDAPLPAFYMKWAPFFRILEDEELKKLVDDRSASMRNLLINHLEELGFFDSSRVGVVDVGWSGQIQDNLYTTVKDKPDCPQVFGFYLGTTLAAHWRKSPNNWMEWTHADYSHLGWAGRSVFEFVQGLEAVIRSPHGTVVGYDYIDKGVVPTFKPEGEASRTAELRDDPVIALFQRGIQDHGRLYSEALTMFGFSAANTLPYACMVLDRMIRFPEMSEAQWFLKISNVSDLGSSDVFTIGGHESVSILQPRKLHRSIRSSFWKYGVLSLTQNHSFQAIFAGLSAIWSVPLKSTGLSEGVVFNRYASADLCSPAPSNHSALHEELLLDIESTHHALIEEGYKQSRIVNLSQLTSPLSLNEVLRSYFAFQLARLICLASKRHIPFNDGLSIKGWLARSIYQSLPGRKIYHILRPR